MEFSGFPVKESYQLPNNASGDNTANRLQADVGIFNQRITGPSSVSTGVDSGSARESENSILSVDVSYKQKLRAGFIDFRNTINDSKYRGVNPLPKTSHGFLGREPLARSCDIPVYSAGETSLAYRDRGFQSRSYKKLNDRRKLYRSNSSLELDHCNNDIGNEVSVLLKDFGSANSLDAVQPGGSNFVSMLHTYRQDIENLDRPSNAKLSDVMRGGMIGGHDVNASTRTNRMTHQFGTNVPAYPSNPVLSSIDGNVAAAMPEHLHSPKPDPKFQKTKEVKARNEGGGIFRKLRGVKSDPSAAAGSLKSSADGNSKSDGNFKAFCHYDCQSIGVRLSDVIKRRVDLTNDASFKRLNVTTGASAASVTRIMPSSSTTDLDNLAMTDESDVGDGKSNDLLLSCAFFHNELGGEEVRSMCINRCTVQRRSHKFSSVRTLAVSSAFMADPLCNGVAVLDTSLTPEGSATKPFQSAGGYVFEYFDQGAFYYRNFFNTYDHQNFFGIDENIGPVAISIKREKVFDKDGKTSNDKLTDGSGWFHQYRIIVRTSELTSLRGSVLEDNIPSSSRLSSAKGLLAKDILDFVVPSLGTSCLHQAVAGKKTSDLLMKVDEQGISKAYKIGVMLCRAGQASEEEMYNNEFSSPAFDEFLNLIATRVKLKGFESYRGGLDIKSDSTGTESFYARLEDNEIMFHISTLLPFTPNNKQQLLRKRHIGNDIVTIIFQEPGALPFTPKSVRSQFQHVFIIVRVHNPNSENTKYSIAVSRSKNVPCFGPLIPEGATFSRSELFREFLLVKAINAENAVHRSDKFMAMAVRTRQEYLKDLATNQVISSSIESGSRLSKLTLGSGRKKDKARLVRIPDIHSKSAVVWSVQVEDFAFAIWVPCLLGIAQETIVIVEESTSSVLFSTCCQLIIGWSLKQDSLKLFYNDGECVHLLASATELKEIVTRLEVVTIGCQTEEKTLYRNADGHLGFHVLKGIVCDIDRNGPAFFSGLKCNCRIVEIGSIIASTLTQDQLIELLRTSKTVIVSLIPPLDDDIPRSYKAHGEHLNPLWRQQISLQESSNHSSLERKSQEKPRGSTNDLHASLEDMDTKAEGCHSNEHPVMFYSSYPAQNAYKGSQLSLSYKADGNTTTCNTPRNSGLTGAVGPKPYSQIATSGSSRASASQTTQSEEFKQVQMLNRKSSNPRDLYYHQQQQQQQQPVTVSSDWQTGDVSSAKPYGQNSRLVMTTSSDSQQQQQLSYSHSFNRGSDHSSPMKPQSGPDVIASSDSVNSDNRTRYKKSAPLKTPNSRLTPSKSFQKDLIRLIDTEVPPSEIRFSSHKASDEALEAMGPPLMMGHSDDNIWASCQRDYSSLDDTRPDTFHQKMPSSNVIEIPGTIYRLQTSHSSSANIPLPVVSSTKDDWSSLLDAADRAFEGDLNDRGALGGGTLGRNSNQSASSALSGMIQSPLLKNTKPVDMTNSGIQLQPNWKSSQQESIEVGQLASSEAQKESMIIKELKARNASLERQLNKERQERSLMEQQLDQLRQDNIRLQEESQTAAAQLRKFTEWFFQTIDKR